MSKRILIIGASRGIGLGLAKVFATNKWEVHVTVRDKTGEDNIARLAGNLFTHQLDVRNQKQIARLAMQLKECPLDILLHNAAVYGKGLSKTEVLRINTIAPITIAQKLVHLVASSGEKKIALITSQMGARNGGSTPADTYGESKCRLNDSFKKEEPAWRALGTTSVVLHPGWVATDMGGPSAPVSVRQSASGIYTVLRNLRPAQSGSFLTWEGKKHPW